MTYTVLAPLVLVRDEAGKTHHHYAGAVIDWIEPSHAAYLVAEGFVSGGPAGGGDPVPGRPAHVAPKADWVAFAVSQGLDRAEAEGMSKQALIQAVQ